MIKVINIFILGSLAGWIYEYLIDGKANYNLGLKLPFLFIYGMGLVILYFLSPIFVDFSLFSKFLIYSITFTVFEYLIAKLSQKYYGYPTWIYKNGKQIDIIPSIVWGILGLLIDQFLIKYL